MARASSPPEAALASGRTASPTLAPSALSIGSPGPLGADPDLHPRPGHGQIGQPLPHQRPELRRGLGPHRPHLLFGHVPAPRPARPAPPPSRAAVSSAFSSSSRRAAASSANAITAARSTPYLRRRSASSRRRSCTATSRSGSSSHPSTTSRKPRATSDRSMAAAAIRSRYSSNASRPASSAGRLGQPGQDATVGPVARAGSEELGERQARPPPGGPTASARRTPAGAARRPRRDRPAGRPRSRSPGSAARRPPGPAAAHRRRARPPPRPAARSPAAQASTGAEIGPGVGVEHRPLGRRRHQRLVLVLPVDLDQLRVTSARALDRRHPPVDPCPRAALGRHRPGDDDLALALGRRRPRSAPRPWPRLAPARTMVGSARPPSTSCSASTTSVLPAPVSPVSTVIPGRTSSDRSSMTPRSRTRSSVSIVAAASAYCSRSASRRNRSSAPKPWGSLRTTRTGRAATRQVTVEPGSRRPISWPSMTSAAARSGAISHRDPLGVGQDQAAVEREVRRHRRDHHGPQRRREDRPAGREVVRRRPGRRGDEHAVGRVGEDVLAVDGGGEADGVAEVDLLEHDLVEGQLGRDRIIAGTVGDGRPRARSGPR